MRILLDEQLSPRRVGERIARRGHDVVCVAADATLQGLTDGELIAFASEDGRLLVTRNARDYVPLTREWASAGRRHAGLLLVWSRDTDEFGSLVREIVAALEAVGDQKAWRNVTRSL